MIVLGDKIYETEESLNYLVDTMEKFSYKEDQKFFLKMYREYLIDSFYADKKLQKMVSDRIGEDFVPFVILPSGDFMRGDSFYFDLLKKDGTKEEVKTRDEKIFLELCDICFGGIKPYYNRLIDFYDE